MRPLNPYAAEWTPAGLRAQAGNVVKDEDDKQTHSAFDLAGLPSEVITTVVSFLTDPRDVASCVCSCKLLKGHVHDAELVLDVRQWKASQGSGNITNVDDIFSGIPKALLGLSKYMPGTVGLLLPNLPLEDSDLEYLVARLPRLQMLDVSGTRKITHSGASVLARAASSVPGKSGAWPSAELPSSPSAPGPAAHRRIQQQRQVEESAIAVLAVRPLPLRFVNLQRCFQLHGGSLDELLTIPGMRGLALSHLDLGRWPPAASSQGPGAGLAGRGLELAPRAGDRLQVLALNNCLRLHGAAIDQLAAVCGGAPGGSGPREGLGSLSRNCSTDGTPGAGGGARFLLLGGSTLALSSFINSAGQMSHQPELPPRLAALLTSAYRPAPLTNATTTQAHLNAARHLVAAVLSLPRLVALDLTFFPQPLVQCVRSVLADGDTLGRPPVQVWDFAGDQADVEAARRTLRRVLCVALQHHTGTELHLPAIGASGRAAAALDELAVATVLRCAVNCSSVTRSTPLHLAAERGNAEGVAALLAAGAVVDARDTAGSTPLFLASEAGHTAVVERLLAAGADPSLGNAAGETPLYIAALRGHLGCVKELLAVCNARGIDWQDPEMYGDAWTPLHAAAVANRADVAAYLLQAAGASGAGELVVAPNKYGQSVLHVAARKGSAQLLRLLLSAGGVAVVASRDGSGDTPVDVAKKNRHVAALAEFRRLTAGAHGAGRAPQAAATAVA